MGFYSGEGLTQREYTVRHGWVFGKRPTLTNEERTVLEGRYRRLYVIREGAPVGGSRNGGSYCFETVPEAPEGSYGFGSSFIAYVDAEDPNRSA